MDLCARVSERATRIIITLPPLRLFCSPYNTQRHVCWMMLGTIMEIQIVVIHYVSTLRGPCIHTHTPVALSPHPNAQLSFFLSCKNMIFHEVGKVHVLELDGKRWKLSSVVLEIFHVKRWHGLDADISTHPLWNSLEKLRFLCIALCVSDTLPHTTPPLFQRDAKNKFSEQQQKKKENFRLLLREEVPAREARGMRSWGVVRHKHMQSPASKSGCGWVGLPEYNEIPCCHRTRGKIDEKTNTDDVKLSAGFAHFFQDGFLCARSLIKLCSHHVYGCMNVSAGEPGKWIIDFFCDSLGSGEWESEYVLMLLVYDIERGKWKVSCGWERERGRVWYID